MGSVGAVVIVKAAIVIENVLVTALGVGAVLSFNWITKENVPVALGWPLITPVEGTRVKPPGNDPLNTDHVYGSMPPVPASVVLYAPLTVPLPSGDVVEITRAGSTVRANSMDAVAWSASVTWIVKLAELAVVGMPLIAPVAGANVRPAGKVDPVLTAQVYGPTPPVSVKVCE